MKTVSSYFTCILSLLFMITSCSQKEILYDDGHPGRISVVFDWGTDSHADVGGMTLYFYPLSAGAKIWRFDIAGKEGGDIELPPGEYEMLTVNNDLPNIIFSDPDKYSMFTASLKTNDQIATSSGMLYKAEVSRLTVTRCGISYTEGSGDQKTCPKSILRCHPDSLSVVYNINVIGIEGNRHVKSLSATLHGTASSILVGNGISTGNDCNLYIPLLSLSDGNNRFSGSATGFKLCYDTSTLILDLTAKMDDNKTYQASIDVTDQYYAARYPHNISLTVRNVVFPGSGDPDIPDDIGISVGVDQWQLVEVDYDTSTM